MREFLNICNWSIKFHCPFSWIKIIIFLYKWFIDMLRHRRNYHYLSHQWQRSKCDHFLLSGHLNSDDNKFDYQHWKTMTVLEELVQQLYFCNRMDILLYIPFTRDVSKWEIRNNWEYLLSGVPSTLLFGPKLGYTKFFCLPWTVGTTERLTSWTRKRGKRNDSQRFNFHLHEYFVTTMDGHGKRIQFL